MTSRSPGQGSSGQMPRKVVSSGHFRVDARRAVEKLREHLLVDLHFYALELVRCASAGGASSIDVRYDSDDLFLVFDGEPFEPEALARLLDHLLSEAATPEARRCRLLALAVNAALGLGAQHVDLYTTAGGAVARVRWTPAMLDPKKQEQTTPQPAAARRPHGLPDRGMCVHVRRRAGWAVLRRAVVGGMPREIGLFADYTHDLPISITVGGAPLEKTPQPQALIRVSLEIPLAARAFLEIHAVTAPQEQASGGLTEPGDAGPRSAPDWMQTPAIIEFLEHGVALVRHMWAPGGGFPDRAVGGVHLPVRVVIDAGSLPTNASRSALREDAALVRLAVERSQAAFRKALDAMVARVRAADPKSPGSWPGPSREPAPGLPGDVEVLCDDPALIEDALGAVICVVAGAARGGATIPLEARALLALPLLRDAVGRPISPEAIGPGTNKAPLYVWSHRARVPEELAPWMGGVVWARGRIVERLFADACVLDAREVVELAREAHERRLRHVAHPRVEPTVAEGQDYLSRDAFHVEKGSLAGLRGEAAIHAPRLEEAAGPPRGQSTNPAPPSAARESTARVFIEGRLLETYPLPRDVCPLPVDLAVAWDGKILANFSFQSVKHDIALDHAIAHALTIAVAAAGRIAASLPSLSPAGAQVLVPILRSAVATHAAVTARVMTAARRGQVIGMAPGPLSDNRGLFEACLWRTPDGGELVSLAGLDSYAAVTGAICTVRDAGGSGDASAASAPGLTASREGRRPPDNRPVIAVSGEELRWLASALGRPVTIVPYDRAIHGAQEGWSPEEHRARALRAALAAMSPAPALGANEVTMAIARPGAAGLITPSRRSRLARLHTGVLLVIGEYAPRYGAVEMALDEDHSVPTPEWNAVLWPKTVAGLDAIERDLCEAIVGSLEGNLDARQRLQGTAPDDPTRIDGRLRDYLIDSATAIRRRRSSAAPPVGGAEAARQTADQTLLARIEALPILTMLDVTGAPAPISLTGITKHHPRARPTPVLHSLPAFFAAPDWRPVIIEDLRAFDSWCGGGTISVEKELPERKKRAEAAKVLAAFLASPAKDVRSVEDMADPGAHVVYGESSTPNGTVSSAVALPAIRGSFVGLDDPAAGPGTLSASVSPSSGGSLKDSRDSADSLVDILFEGRFIERRTIRAGVPVVARVNLANPAHIVDYRKLSSKGQGEVAGLVRQGALALGLALLEEPAPGAPIFGDIRALRLIAALLGADLSQVSTAPLRASLCSERVLWPTVQGEEHPFLRLKTSLGQIDIGQERYVSWRLPERGRNELDQPILYLPIGEIGQMMEEILRSLALTPRNVTWALATLQTRRASAVPSRPAPRLEGSPAHPALQVALASVGVISCDGQLEIVAGPGSDVVVAGIEGLARTLRIDLPFPIRAVVRAEIAEATEQSARSTLLDLARGARVHLRGLAPRLDELPGFVRDHLRALICETLSRRTALAPKDQNAPVFLDIAGRYHTLAELRAASDPAALTFTTDPPPYPACDAGSPVLRLQGAEAGKLSADLDLTDVTSRMRSSLAGERRASAAQATLIALGEEHRGACIHVGAVNDGRLVGEVGILSPTHAAARGIEVFTTRRPLCLLDDGRGWPLRAAVDDPEARPNRQFDGLESTKLAAAIRARVRAAADRALMDTLRPPADALAVRWLGTDSREAEPLHVIGALWLPPVWPALPLVTLRLLGRDGVATSKFLLGLAPSSLEQSAPVGGELLIAEDGSVGSDGSLTSAGWSLLTAMVGRLTRALVDEARSLGGLTEGAEIPFTSVADTIAEYSWNLALVDGQPGMTAPTADGKSVSSTDIVTELQQRGCLWFTSRQGVAEGDFPGDAPGFVLLDGGPLMTVLRARLPAGSLRELGGASPAPSPPRPVSLKGEGEPEPEAAQPPLSWGQSTEISLPGEPPEGPDPSGSSWLAGLIRRSVSMVRPEDRDAPLHDPLRLALQGALDGLPAVGPEIVSFAYAGSGRPLRFVQRTRRLVLYREHPAVAALAAKAPADPRARSVLLAAALTEVNRALEGVTDAEEIRILRELLSPSASDTD